MKDNSGFFWQIQNAQTLAEVNFNNILMSNDPAKERLIHIGDVWSYASHYTTMNP